MSLTGGECPPLCTRYSLDSLFPTREKERGVGNLIAVSLLDSNSLTAIIIFNQKN